MPQNIQTKITPFYRGDTDVAKTYSIWLGKRGVVRTILEDYRGQDTIAEIQEIQQFLDDDDSEEPQLQILPARN